MVLRLAVGVCLDEAVVKPEHAPRARQVFDGLPLGDTRAARHVTEGRQLGDRLGIRRLRSVQSPLSEPFHHCLQLASHAIRDLGTRFEEVVLLPRGRDRDRRARDRRTG